MAIMELNFLGKDSVPFKKAFEIPNDIAVEFQKLLDNKKNTDQVFDLAGESEVNNFLKENYDECTAKLFRTAYGTKLLAEELQKHLATKEMSLAKKQSIYNNACLVVSKKLNHQKNVSKNFNDQILKANSNIDEAKSKFNEKKIKAKNSLLQVKKDIATAKKCFTGEKLKDKLKKLKEKKDKIQISLEKAEIRLEKLELTKDFKKDTANIAINTAKSAYSSPEIAFSWCKDNNVDISFIYSKTLQDRYSWAADVSPDYYKKYPNVKDHKEEI